MTFEEVLEELHNEIEKDGLLSEEVDLDTMIDYLGIVGVPGAADIYLDRIYEAVGKIQG